MLRPVFLAAGTALLTFGLGVTPVYAAADDGTISGVVTDSRTKQRIAHALVFLQCICLQGLRETETNDDGLYAFRNLPPGTYTVQVFVGEADVSKVATLGRGAKFRANFTIDPSQEFKRVVKVKPVAVKMDATVGRTVSMEEMRSIPVGNATSRDFTQTADYPRSSRSEPTRSTRQKLAEHRRDAVAMRADGPSSTTRARPAPDVTPPEVEQATPNEPIKEDYARKVVYTGAMGLAVYNLDKTKERVETLVVEAGGYVQSLKAQTMVLRIPAADFRTVAAKIGKLGRLDYQEFEALDVTEDFYDTQTRIEVLRRTQKQLLDLLDKARTVSQALEVRRELDKVTLELESLLGQQRVLAAQIQFSALSLALEERIPDPDVPSTNDPFPWVDEIGVEGTAWR